MNTTSNKRFVVYALALAGVVLVAFNLPQKHITVYMIGDSTMSVKDKRAYPETGWGMPFANFFDTTVTIDNRAKNGRSTKTFISEGLWQPVADHMKPGDYLLIQFGHNDEVSTKASYATEDQFRNYLTTFVTEAKNKQVTPVLITPVARRKFDATGKIEDTHAVYAQIVRDVARTNNVILIDLDKLSMDMLQTYGPDQTKLFFNHVAPGENTNYPDGNADDTHFNEYGARRMAQLVLNEMIRMKLDLAGHIIKPKPVTK